MTRLSRLLPNPARLRRLARRGYLALRERLLAPFVPAPGPLPVGLLKGNARILVLTMDRLGDLVCSLPFLTALREAAPRAVITVCSPPYLKELLAAQATIDRWQGPGEVRGQVFDLAFDLSTDYVLAKTWLARGVSWRVGFNVKGRGALLTHTLPCPGADTHTADKLLGLLRLAGVTPGSTTPRPWCAVAEEWRGQSNAVLKALGLDPSLPYAVIHPGGTYGTQRWPADRFAAIADRLAGRLDNPPILIGGPAELGVCGQVAALAASRPINLCGRLSMGGLAALLAGARLLVANNSGPLHLATAVGTRTVSTMGPTLPAVWWPLGEGHTVLRHPLPCVPCNEGECRLGETPCLLAISVDEVWQAVAAILWETGHAAV